MKTPREILLARHEATNAKLDDIRRAAIWELNNQGTKQQNRSDLTSLFLRCSRNFWRELILPRPQAWAGLAVIWVVILALKFSTRDASHVAGRTSSVPPEIMAELKQQKHLFAELAGIPQLSDVKPSKPFLPRPRSARRCEIFAV